MSMVTRSIPVVVLALCVGVAQLSAQRQGNENFQWYIGGQGGVMNFETPAQTRGTIPLGGAHLLVKARRTGLLVSVDQGFGSKELAGYDFTITDKPDTTVLSAGTQSFTFNYIRRYSAMLMAFPVKGHVTPFFGIGGGIQHTGGHNPDDQIAKDLGSSGFGSVLIGLQFRISRFIGFGQYQVTTAPSVKTVVYDQGVSGQHLHVTGSNFRGAIHSLSAGLRFSLGGSREGVSGGY